MNIFKPTTSHQMQNGHRYIIRSAMMNDAPLLFDMHERSSDTTRYNRYGHHFDYAVKHFAEWIALPPNKGVMLVALEDSDDRKIVGMAQYVVEYDDMIKIAEPGIIIEDNFQGQGLGWLLTRELGRIARVNGVEHFHTFISGSNNIAMHLVSKSNLSYASAWEFGTRELVIDLDRPLIRQMNDKRVVSQLANGLETLWSKTI